VSVQVIGSYPLGTINVGLNGTVALAAPLLAQFDLMLTGSFGLGALAADLAMQLNAALSMQISLSLKVINPFDSLMAQLSAILQIQASIAATIALGLPAMSASLSLSLSASAAIVATLGIKVGGLNLLIRAALAVKLPLVSLLGSFNLSAGPFELLAIGYDAPTTLAASGAQYAALAAGGFGGILPGDQVFGVIMLTKSPSASVALSTIIRTS
jgi:hypothetical protein